MAMKHRLSVEQMCEYSGRKHKHRVRDYFASQGWTGRPDTDGWPIVELTWWNDNQNQRAEAVYSVDVGALRKAA